MAERFETLAALLQHGFDTLIDVRSPAEYAEDHIPGAISLPVLNDAERAEIGTIYKQQSPFLARKHGAARVFRNAADHVEHRLMDLRVEGVTDLRCHRLHAVLAQDRDEFLHRQLDTLDKCPGRFRLVRTRGFERAPEVVVDGQQVTGQP